MNQGVIPHILIERLLDEEIQVPLDVLLVDLWYLDGMMLNWQPKERQYALAGGILRRKFIRDAATAVRIAGLWLRLRQAYHFEHVSDVLSFSDGVHAYTQTAETRVRHQQRAMPRHRIH